MGFIVEQAGKYTSTKRAVETWPEAEAAAAEFINATITSPDARAALLAWVLDVADDEAIALPNGKRLSIYTDAR